MEYCKAFRVIQLGKHALTLMENAQSSQRSIMSARQMRNYLTKLKIVPWFAVVSDNPPSSVHPLVERVQNHPKPQFAKNCT